MDYLSLFSFFMKTYFLFGEEAISEFEENGITEELLNCGMSLFVWDSEKSQPWELLEEFKGNGDYIILDEDEFKKCENL